jgi:ribosomal-protein-alanine N-acetyltransferase
VAAPEVIRTARLVLRRPALDDVDEVYAYASNAELAKYMAWARHVEPEETAEFLARAQQEWDGNGVGVYLITDPASGHVMGSTGLHLATPYRGVTGYILEKRAWGQGYATEACTAMVELARQLGLSRIDADCHVDHVASARVLEKSGLRFEGIARAYLVFPNLDAGRAHDVRVYGLALLA